MIDYEIFCIFILVLNVTGLTSEYHHNLPAEEIFLADCRCSNRLLFVIMLVKIFMYTNSTSSLVNNNKHAIVFYYTLCLFMKLCHHSATQIIKLPLENCYDLFLKYYWIKVTIPVIPLDTKGFSLVRLSIQLMMCLKNILGRIKQFKWLTTLCYVCFCGWCVLIYKRFLFFGKISIYATSSKRKLVSRHGSSLLGLH
jgi:hypothetical protein